MSEECGERVFIPVLKKKKIERDYDLLFSILFICLFVFILFYFTFGARQMVMDC